MHIHLLLVSKSFCYAVITTCIVWDKHLRSPCCTELVVASSPCSPSELVQGHSLLAGQQQPLHGGMTSSNIQFSVIEPFQSAAFAAWTLAKYILRKNGQQGHFAQLTYVE